MPIKSIAEQLTYTTPDLELVLLPGVGARIHRLVYRGHDLLSAPADVSDYLRDPFSLGAFPMAPWGNRLEPAPQEVAGRLVDLSPNFSDGTAIHGQVYAASWQVTGDELSIDGGGGGWPWRYRTTLRVSVSAAVVRLEQRLTNLDDRPMPGGLGLHPWFAGQPQVAVHSDLVYPSNLDSAALPVPVSGDLDLRRLGPMAVGIDAAWPQVADPAAELFWPDTGVRLVLRVDSPTAHVVAAKPRGRAVIALESQTHAPQGLRRLRNGEPGALVLVQPGESLRLVSELALSTG